MKISDLILLQQIVDITRNLKVNKCEIFVTVLASLFFKRIIFLLVKWLMNLKQMK